MAPVILCTVVHCEDCAKKIKRALKKVPGVEEVTAEVESGLVIVEGSAHAEALRARLAAKVAHGNPVMVLSDGTAEPSSSSPPSRPAPARPLVLKMNVHCETCARKIRRLVMKIPGVESVTADVATGRVEVVGTADAETVATAIGTKSRRAVKVLSEPGNTGFSGYEPAEPRARPPTIREEEAGTNGGAPAAAATTAQGGGSSSPPVGIQQYGTANTTQGWHRDVGQAGWYSDGGNGGQGWYGGDGGQQGPPGGYAGYNYYHGEGEVYGGPQGPRGYRTADGYHHSEAPPGEVLHYQRQRNYDENANCRIQ